MSELLERLGGAPQGRALIITCDNLGQSHAANAAIAECLDIGVATAASLMVPCPWARDAAGRFAHTPVGVDLTLNAEFDNYRWGPITQAPSLLDGDGGFPRTPADSWEHGDLDEAHRECRAQIERASQWGSDLTHLSPHLDTLLMRPEFFDVYLELAVEMALPMRLGGSDQERRAGFPFRRLAADAGVLAPDHLVQVRGPSRSADPRGSVGEFGGWRDRIGGVASHRHPRTAGNGSGLAQPGRTIPVGRPRPVAAHCCRALWRPDVDLHRPPRRPAPELTKPTLSLEIRVLA